MSLFHSLKFNTGFDAAKKKEKLEPAYPYGRPKETRFSFAFEPGLAREAELLTSKPLDTKSFSVGSALP